MQPKLEKLTNETDEAMWSISGEVRLISSPFSVWKSTVGISKFRRICTVKLELWYLCCSLAEYLIKLFATSSRFICSLDSSTFFKLEINGENIVYHVTYWFLANNILFKIHKSSYFTNSEQLNLKLSEYLVIYLLVDAKNIGQDPSSF